MASLTIRNLEDETKNGLRLRAAMRGASMEEEARSILRLVVSSNVSLEEISKRRHPAAYENAWESIRQLREKHGTFDIEIPHRAEIAGKRVDFGS